VYGLDYGQYLFHGLSHGPLRAIEDIPYAFPRSAATACDPEPHRRVFWLLPTPDPRGVWVRARGWAEQLPGSV